MSPDDRILFDRWTDRRDAEAFNEMARRYAGMVYHTCVRVLRNHADAQDVAQECFETLAGLRKAPTASLGAYLHAMAFNKALNRIKSERRRSERESRYVLSQPPRDAATWDDLYGEVDAAIAALPANLREPIIAHFLEGLTHEAIAQREGVSRPAVTQRIQRGVEAVRASLRRKGIAVGAAALSALLAENASGAAPAGVLGTIGKLSVAGVSSPAGVSFFTAPMAAALALCVVLGGGVFLYITDAGEQAGPTARAAVAPDVGEPVALEEVDRVDAMTAPPPGLSARTIPAEPAAIVTGSADHATVFGVVIDALGEPVAGAQVEVRGDLGSGAFGGTISGADGAYRVTGIVPAAEVRVHADRSEPPLRSPQVSLSDVRAGEVYECNLTALDLRAEGRVVDALGRDLSVARILAHPADPYDGGLPVSDLTADGHFAVDGLVPGEWEWKVQFPGGEWRSTGRRFTIQTRSLSNVRVEIGGESGHLLAGVVRDADGVPLPGAYVRAHMVIPPHDSQTGLTDTDGRFVLEGLSEGRYFVHAAHRGFGSAYQQNTPVPMDGEVDLTLPRRGGLTARIVDAATGAPVPSFEVFESKPVGGDNPTTVTQNWERIESPEGVYTASNLPPQPFAFRVRAEGYALYETELTIPAGAILDDVVVSLERERILTGRVVDGLGEPVDGAQLFEAAIPSTFEMDRMQIGRSGGDGRFEVGGLRPGSFVLAAHHHGYAPTWIEVAEGADDVTVRLTAGATVRATVTASGAAYADVYVAAHYAAHKTSIEAVRPDANGLAVLERLAPGEEVMILAAAKYASAAMGNRTQYLPLRLRDGEIRDAAFHFAVEDTRLEVPVTEDGVPMPGLYCWVKYDFPGGAFATVDTHTDGRGMVALEGLPTGACTLIVMPPGLSRPEEGVHLSLEIQPGLNTAACAYSRDEREPSL